jgi:hypothetical protein
VKPGLRKIRIVCTCRAPDLEPQRLGFILEVGNRSPVGAGCPPMMRDEHGHGTGYRLRCGRCPRAPVVAFETWQTLVAGLDEAGADTLDIAALPF